MSREQKDTQKLDPVAIGDRLYAWWKGQRDRGNMFKNGQPITVTRIEGERMDKGEMWVGKLVSGEYIYIGYRKGELAIGIGSDTDEAVRAYIHYPIVIMYLSADHLGYDDLKDVLKGKFDLPEGDQP